MKKRVSNFTKDTSGMVSIDWIGIAAGVAISASSAVSFIGDRVSSQTDHISSSLHDASPCPDELHFIHADNGLEVTSSYYPPQP